MKNFKNYTPKTQRTEPMATDELIKQIATAYDGKSNAQMLKSILIEAEKSKRAGTLSNEEIDAFYHSFSPMLDNAQRKKLREIIEKLKKI